MSLIILFVVGLFHGLLAGGALAWLVYRSRSEVALAEARRAADLDLTEYGGRVRSAEQRATQLYNDLEKREVAIRTLSEARGRLEAELAEERRRAAFLEQSESRLRESFDAAAARALAR